MFLKKIHDFKNTLFFRLTLLYALIFIFSTSITFAVFYYRIYSVTMDNLDEELSGNIQEFKKILSENGNDGVITAIAAEVQPEEQEKEFLRLLDFNGEIQASTNMASWGSVSARAVALFKANRTEPVYETITVPGRKHDARLITAPIGPGALMQIGETLEDADEYLDIFFNLFIILIFTLLIVSLLIGWFLAGRALNDMEDVTQTARQISRGNFEQRVRIKGRFEEIKRLGATFNNMLDRIQVLLKSMKEINDNIAHDLRSPLARIRGFAEMTLVGDKPVKDYQDMAANTIEECDSLIEMINTMLDITEAEAGVQAPDEEEFDLVPMINGACDLFRPLAGEKDIVLETRLPRDLPLCSDRKKMQRVLTNLLENAIKYTPQKGAVVIQAEKTNSHIRIAFKDTGIGISENDMPRIFDRFYRCDRSRPQGGVGLGLSLVKAYIEAMGGYITVKSQLNQGSEFELQF